MAMASVKPEKILFLLSFFSFLWLMGCSSASSPEEEFLLITPLEGAWISADGEEIGFSGGELDSQNFPTRHDVTASIVNPVSTCGVENGFSEIELQGEIDNGRLTLYVAGTEQQEICLEGRFTDLRKLEIDGSDTTVARTYINSRVDVALEIGVWSDGADPETRLLFFSPNSVNNDFSETAFGCDLSEGAVLVDFEGELQGFGTATLTNPVISELNSSSTGVALYENVELIQRDRLSLLTSDGTQLLLNRTPFELNLAQLPEDCTNERLFR